ncbi:MAG: macro domain-containing protein [Lachnospiraceae bacterium]|nr:macro domain-containing protein [Lachnospiraceae bacterium]
MSLKIIRNNIVNMSTDAIVNTANPEPVVGSGCDYAIYEKAGFEKLLEFRKKNIGRMNEGEVFVTPAFDLNAKFIIHAVSPIYMDGASGEEQKLRNCYKKSLEKAVEYGCNSISFPVVSTGSFGYPKEEGLNIAVEEINNFLESQDIDVYIVVFDDTNTELGKKIYPDLEEYISSNYAEEKVQNKFHFFQNRKQGRDARQRNGALQGESAAFSAPNVYSEIGLDAETATVPKKQTESDEVSEKQTVSEFAVDEWIDFEEIHGEKLNERIKHSTDTFSEYLLYLIKEKNMTNAEVYNRALVNKKVFSKIKNNKDYHPQKITALCLCVGARLNMDETRDILRRAGYALSPCDKTDIIFSYFIENGIYDMLELDIQLEEHGLACILG